MKKKNRIKGFRVKDIKSKNQQEVMVFLKKWVQSSISKFAIYYEQNKSNRFYETQ